MTLSSLSLSLCCYALNGQVSALNGWRDPLRSGGLGLRCILALPGVDDGVAFTDRDPHPVTVVLHTAASARLAPKVGRLCPLRCSGV